MLRSKGEGEELSKGNERWFVVYTLPRRELQARLHLEWQGFRTYLPHIQKTVRHARQMRTVQAPLFPRYLFIELDVARDRWLSVQSTVGVSHLVTCDDRPLPVPAGVVEGILERTDEAGLTLLDSELCEGQRVRILSGPFSEFIGTLERLDEAGRVRVLLDMMGSAIPVALRRSALAPAA